MVKLFVIMCTCEHTFCQKNITQLSSVEFVSCYIRDQERALNFTLYYAFSILTLRNRHREKKTFIIGSGAQIKQDSSPGAVLLDIAAYKQICSRHNNTKDHTYMCLRLCVCVGVYFSTDCGKSPRQR